MRTKNDKINTEYTSQLLEKILGCLYCVCVGDALGSRYEFMENDAAELQINKDIFNNKLLMLGGGPFNLQPGQITDDSEMTLCLLNSISFIGYYDQEHVGKTYIAWFNTNPVDMGKTISKSLFTRKRSLNYIDMIKNNLANKF